jgi:hypothetical protein
MRLQFAERDRRRKRHLTSCAVRPVLVPPFTQKVFPNGVAFTSVRPLDRKWIILSAGPPVADQWIKPGKQAARMRACPCWEWEPALHHWPARISWPDRRFPLGQFGLRRT